MPSFAMKVYDRQWRTTYGMSVDEAAAELVRDGIGTVLCSNQIDPLPTSGVDQERYLADAAGPDVSDAEWTAALRRAGLRVLQTSAVLFDPPQLHAFPDAVPIDARGKPDPGIDWYRGVCPTHPGYLARKLGLIERVIDELRPDGVFLQFMRYPGFWEQWTWDPDYVFTDADRFCFCTRCRTLFAEEAGILLPAGDVAAQASAILREHGAAWHGWRAGRIAGIVGEVRARLHARLPDATLVLNTLPFPASDFDGADVRRAIAAQDLPALAPVVDGFELMTYLQILKRPPAWGAEAVRDALRQLTGTGREVLCTLQVDALYTDGVHADRRRAPAVTADDLLAGAEAALRAGADGLVFYHWTDFLVDEAAGGRKRAALRQITGA